MQRIAARYGAVGVATLMNISLSGWGLILLGAAVACEVGAVVLTPTELQKWVQRRYFGYGKGSEKKFTDWGSELSVLGNVFVTPASKSDAKQTPQSGYGIVHSHAVFHSHETRANYGNVHCYKKAIEDGKVKIACQ